MLPLKRVIAAAAMTALFVALIVRHSMAVGGLSIPPTYDDIGYFVDAADRLQTLYSQGFSGFVSEAIARPLYSPSSILLAMLGFSVLGIAPWAAVAANSLPVFALVLTFLWIARGLPFWTSVVLAIALLGFPFMSALVLDCRPDMVCAALTAVGTLLIVLGPWVDRQSVAATAGLLFGLALISKLTVFHLTGFLFGAAFCISAVINWGRWRELTRATLITSTIGLLLAAPFYYLAWQIVWTHIYDSVFGKDSGLFALNIGFSGHALFYLTGLGGRFATGMWLPLVLIVIFTYAAGAVMRRDRRSIGAVILIMACWIVVSTAKMKTEFIGISLGAYFLALFSVILVARLTKARQWARAVIPIALLAFSISIYQSAWAGRDRSPIAKWDSDAKQKILKDTSDAISKYPVRDKILLYTALPDSVGPTTLDFSLITQSRPRPKYTDRLFATDQADIKSGIDAADFILAPDPTADVVFWLPSSKTLNEVLAYLRARPDFELVETIPGSASGPLYLFKRTRPNI